MSQEQQTISDIEAEVMRKYPKQEEESRCWRMRHALTQLRNLYRSQLQAKQRDNDRAAHTENKTV